MNSKEEILKIQTCVLKVYIHCDGCKHKVKKILQKIDGVFTIKIESEQSKLTVSGTADPSVIINKLTKSGKHAQLWPSPEKSPQNGGGGGPAAGNIPSGKGGGMNAQQQLKGFQDLKLLPPQFKDMGQNQPPPKAAAAVAAPAGKKFSFPEDEDDEFSDGDDFDDEDEFSGEEDEFSSEEDDFSGEEFSDDDMEDDDDMKPSSKTKPMIGNSMGGGGGGGGGGNSKMMMMMKAAAAADGCGGKTGNNNGGGINGNNQKGGADGQSGGMNVGGSGGSDAGGLPQMMNKGFPMGGGGQNSLNDFPGQLGPPESPYLQQQHLAGGSGYDPRFQHMMYARPDTPVNYMPAYPYAPYPNPYMHPAQPRFYTHMFSDENAASSCSVM